MTCLNHFSCLTRRVLLVFLLLSVLMILPAAATVHIDPIAEYVVGDRVTVGGTTNYAVGDKLWVMVSSSDFHPTTKYESIEQTSDDCKASGTVRIQKGEDGTGLNRWSINFSTTGWIPNEYVVRVSEVGYDQSMLWASSSFKLAPESSRPISTAPAVSVTTEKVVTTAPASPLSIGLAIAGLIGAICLVCLKTSREK